VTVSVVSHAHESLVAKLLSQLAAGNGGLVEHVVLTHNLAAAAMAAPAGGWPFRFTELFNQVPAGYGANHNRAFEQCDSEFFCVLNPDVDVSEPSLWPRLVQCFADPGVGCAYPVLLNPDGSRQENAREVVTPLALVRRHIFKRKSRHVDWASGAFWLVSANAWRELGGFDEGYFMYCEDVDFCLRLQLAGWKLAAADVTVLHDASWGSREDRAHLAWHVRSMIRLWLQPSLRRYLRWRRRAA
jgi:N-acetylglucosaminyl-diphospho-decaprenol L-rhamnosyltransferase